MVIIKNKEYVADELIIRRKEIIELIKEKWDKILIFNIVDKTYDSKVDVKKLYDDIKELEMELINIKLAVQGINMRMTTMSQLKDSSYPSIYTLSQLKERKEKLRILLKNITGKTNDVSKASTIVLNSDFITAEVKVIDKEMKEIEEDLKAFNKIAKFTM